MTHQQMFVNDHRRMTVSFKWDAVDNFEMSNYSRWFYSVCGLTLENFSIYLSQSFTHLYF